MKAFKLENIKSFKESENIELKPITIFVGKNSCGKSSLIRFPVVLAQTFQEDVISPLLLFGNMIDYGNYDDIVNKHVSEPIGFEIQYSSQELERQMRRVTFGITRNKISKFSKKYKKVILKVKICKSNKKMVVQRIELLLDKDTICLIDRSDNGQYLLELCCSNLLENDMGKYSFSGIKFSFQRFMPIFDTDEILNKYKSQLENIENIDEIIEEVTMNYGYFEEENQNRDKELVAKLYNTIILTTSLFRAINSMLVEEARGLTYIGPFRENPKRTYRDSESTYNDVGVRGENVSMLLRQDAQANRELLNEVSNWFRDAMECKLDVRDVGSSLFSVVVKKGDDCEDNIIDTGYGISQVLPIVTQLYNTYGAMSREQQRYFGIRQKNVFILEQPELHLHPAAQAQLADLFVNNVINNKSRKLLIETHSEHLIRKLQVLIADPEVKIDNDQVAIYYIDKDSDNNSIIKNMKIASNGQFEDEWPSGFFDKSYELTKLLLRANRRGK